MATTEQLLTQILAELKKLNGALAGSAGKSTVRSSSGGDDVASDRELDSDHGNPAVRKNPPRWNADVNGSYVGCNFSECPADFLDTLAGFFDWQAEKDEQANKMHNGKPTAPWRRKDAKIARGWARRKRDGWEAPVGAGGGQSAQQDDGAAAVDDPLPF